MAVINDQRTALRTGEEFRQGLRDGRTVYVGDRRVEDVTKEPSLGPGIDLMASMFDAQFAPETEEITTFFDPELGARVNRAWQVPKTPEEMVARRKLIEYTSFKTAGTFGRPPDLGPTIALGLLEARLGWETNRPDLVDNIANYIKFARERGLVAAEVLADPQTDRSMGSANHPGLLRIVETAPGGVYVTGSKSVGSLAAQADEIIFTNVRRPDYPPEALIQAAIPVASEGLTLVCREGVATPGADPFDHPLGVLGEEADQLLIFDRVFIPDERIFNLGDDGQENRFVKVIWAHWHILTRLWVKAQIFLGAGKLVVDALGTGQVPAVRAMVAELIQYEQTLRAFLLASESQATITASGTILPDVNLTTSGRLHAVESYPRIIHTLQELCGQGLVMRFPKSAFEHPDIGPRLAELLPGHDISAAGKNRLMNFVWDLTSSSQAGRTELFENVNATPVPLLQQRLFDDYDTSTAEALAHELAGLEDA
ncbi:MAG TPA: 4-hydroxyphenylacetate 3-hydroxylase N-terminal domain-containing protein [Baekduia sp.]|nr:4-hydroxyphenylacetate 3-hydroxylase N-terminal domain-containing protein [Baekduia sp.]